MQLHPKDLSRTFYVAIARDSCLRSSRCLPTASRRDDDSVCACASSIILHCGTSGLPSNFRFAAPCNYGTQVACRSGSALLRTLYASLIRMSMPLQPAAAC